MSGPEWILCERTNRWASALRTALSRERSSQDGMPRLYEVRSLRDLSARLAARPDSLVLIEVDRATVGAVLAWLADAQRRYSDARFAALFDSELARPPSTRATPPRNNRQDALDAVIEAGACDVALSPRHLRGILALGRRHANRLAARPTMPDDRSITAWAWASLPWQDE